MGFDENRAMKATMFAVRDDLEECVNWLMEHQDDADINEPVPADPELTEGQGEAATLAEIAQSYKVQLFILSSFLPRLLLLLCVCFIT